MDNKEGEKPKFWRFTVLSTKGSSNFMSDCRVRGDTPASVRSPQAPLRRSKACRRIIIETSSPMVHQNKLRLIILHSWMLTTNRIQREGRENPSAQDGEQCNETRICITAMMDGIGP